MNEFVILTDSASNLTDDFLDEYEIGVLPYVIGVDGEELVCYEKGFNLSAESKKLLDKIYGGAKITTTLINGERFKEFVLPYLNAGKDVLYFCMSSGISGTFDAVYSAASALRREFPSRRIAVIDTLGASFGEGLQVLRAAKRKKEGKSFDEILSLAEEEKKTMRQVFTVNDLKYLMNGGRISRLVAVIGTLLNVKPVLKGKEGKIVSHSKVKGRKRALDALIQDFGTTAIEPELQTVAIAHFGAKEDAFFVAKRLKEEYGVKEVIVRDYDLCTGTYVGPGTVALFFQGKND